MTRTGMDYVEELLPFISCDYRRRMDEILEKFRSFTLVQLRDYVYRKHIRKLDEDKVIKRNLQEYIERLVENCSIFTSSHNSLLLQGSLDYCSLALEKAKILDSVQRDYLFRTIYDFCFQLERIINSASANPEILVGMNLQDLEEGFETIQEVCEEIGILPKLENDSEVDAFLQL